MLSPRVLFALLLLLLAALLDARSVSRYPRGPVSEHGGQTLERERRSHHGPEGSKDPRHKEKFITHLTGPLYFNPKCRKQFNRLYHNTRDCTVAAYYRRCALLLVRLANSPRCAERCAVTHGYRWTSRCDNKEAEAS